MTVFQATVIFSIATYLDVILNPLMGFITDNFIRKKTRSSLWSSSLLHINCHSMYDYLSIALGKWYSFWYYLSTYIIFEVVYTMIMIPYNTLPVEMTKIWIKGPI
ncbi:hypothetical protein ACLB1O_20445 [Escherichia coli]